jgi:hypothetical protein
MLEEVYGIKTTFLNSIKMAAASQMGTKFLVGLGKLPFPSFRFRFPLFYILVPYCTFVSLR